VKYNFIVKESAIVGYSIAVFHSLSQVFYASAAALTITIGGRGSICFESSGAGRPSVVRRTVSAYFA